MQSIDTGDVHKENKDESSIGKVSIMKTIELKIENKKIEIKDFIFNSTNGKS